jgi:hypothetical protein
MTVQAPDYVHIGKKKYVLIDVEEDKQIITCADFGMPDSTEMIICTSCWRGYMADYYVIRKTLYGIKMDPVGKNRSSRTFIPYTGSCIIAYGDYWNSDFIESYLYYDEAFELYFENGILKEKLTLSSAIEKARAFRKTDEYKNNGDIRDIMEQIAREPLKYNYGGGTHKWRNNNDDDNMKKKQNKIATKDKGGCMNAQYRETVNMPDAVKEWLKGRHKTVMVSMSGLGKGVGEIGALAIESTLIERWFNALGEDLVEPGTQYLKTINMPDVVKEWLNERYGTVSIAMRNLSEDMTLSLKSPDGKIYDTLNLKHQDIIHILSAELTLIARWFNVIGEELD